MKNSSLKKSCLNYQIKLILSEIANSFCSVFLHLNILIHFLLSFYRRRQKAQIHFPPFSSILKLLFSFYYSWRTQKAIIDEERQGFIFQFFVSAPYYLKCILLKLVYLNCSKIACLKVIGHFFSIFHFYLFFINLKEDNFGAIKLLYVFCILFKKKYMRKLVW